jgi:hypothetical protein
VFVKISANENTFGDTYRELYTSILVEPKRRLARLKRLSRDVTTELIGSGGISF